MKVIPSATFHAKELRKKGATAAKGWAGGFGDVGEWGVIESKL
jgi:hypothetical protein